MVLVVSALALVGSLTVIATAGPGSYGTNAGQRPSSRDTVAVPLATSPPATRAVRGRAGGEGSSRAPGTVREPGVADTARDAQPQQGGEREQEPAQDAARDRNRGRDRDDAARAEDDSATVPRRSPTRGQAAQASLPAGRVDATVLPARAPGARPVELRLPAIGVTARVEAVGLTHDGQVEVPHDVAVTGWYLHSKEAGAAQGSSVIVGHRDGKGQGPGAFYDLGSLDLGDTVVVLSADGSRHRYEVVAREAFDKTGVPLDELFSGAGPHRLTLITCAGPFDTATLGYTDNIVVTAVPSSPGG